MTTIFVSSGVTSTGVTVSSGNLLDVLSSGTASGTHIQNGGLETVEAGGVDTTAVVSSGGILTVRGTFAIADADTILAGGQAIVSANGYIAAATVRGFLTVSSGGFTQEDVVSSGGYVIVSSGGSANVTNLTSGAQQDVYAGGTVSQTQISGGGVEVVFGTAVFDDVFSGGADYVEAGGTASGTFVNSGGDEFVLAGGHDSGTRISNGGFQSVQGTSYSGTVFSGGVVQVLSGGLTSGTVVSAGGVENLFSGGSAIVLSGQTTHGLDAQGGRIIVSSGGTVANPTIVGGRLELTNGAAVLGSVDFAFTGGGVLRIDGSTMPTNTISGLVPSDAFNLRNIAFSAFGTAKLGSGNVLHISENGSTYSLNLNPVENFVGRDFALSDDGVGGTRVTEVVPRSDLNGDGRSDILLHNVGNGLFVDWAMSGSSISSAKNLTFNGSPVALDSSWVVNGTGDFSDDGRADILLHNTNGSFAEWTMSGATIDSAQNLTFNGSAVALDSSWSVVAVDNFSGGTDILLRNSNGSFVEWGVFNATIQSANNLTFGGSPVALDSSWSVVASGDFNGDNRADILLHNTNGNFVDWAMGGAGSITNADQLTFQGNPVALDNSWTVLGASDLNGNGRADILLRGSDGSFVDWTMNGSAIVSADDLTFGGTPVRIDSSWTFAELGDFNGDGKADILLRNTNGSFIDWTMNGATITGAGSVTFQGNQVMLDTSWQTV